MDSEMLRGKPLSKDETKSLLTLIEDSKVIMSKKTNASCNKEKSAAWVAVTNRFNATSTVHRRTPQQLRLKWENLKKNARKRCTKIRMNRIQTGGGIKEYVPPDDVLDRVADLLGSTASGFVVPFGGDKEPQFVLKNNNGDGSSDEAQVPTPGTVAACCTASTSAMPEAIDTSISIPVSITPSTMVPETVIQVTECKPFYSTDRGTFGASTRFTMPRTGKKKLKTADTSKTSRNLALAEYYTTKKLCLDAKLEQILLQNENLKLENEKLKLELEKLKFELEELKGH